MSSELFWTAVLAFIAGAIVMALVADMIAMRHEPVRELLEFLMENTTIQEIDPEDRD